MATSFKLEHEFSNIPLDKFIAHLNDPKLNQMLLEGLGFTERKLLERKDSAQEIEWRFKVSRNGELPAPIKKIIKEDGFSWLEISRLVRKENCIHWEIIPQIKALKFHGEGMWLLTALNHGCKRIIKGQVSVEIPLVGKLLEKFIVDELVKLYEKEPKIQEKFYSQIA